MTADSAPLTSPSLSLAEFVTGTSGCETCNLPAEILAEIHAARSADPKRFTYAAIAEWLERVCGIEDFHPDRLRRHFNRGHNK